MGHLSQIRQGGRKWEIVQVYPLGRLANVDFKLVSDFVASI